MTSANSPATAAEIHAHLIKQFNRALRSPETFGGEVALHLLITNLLFVERRPDAYTPQRQAWIDNKTFRATGVTGAYRELIPGHSYNDGMASVYAEFAQQCGWLESDRLLTTAEYETLTGSVRQWAEKDRTWPDVTATFGPPSVLLGGDNPLYGKTLGYLSEDMEQPMVLFHLWNGSAPGTNSWPPDHEQPLLLAVRFGEGLFPDTFTFTPEGERKRPRALCPH
ncbi:hypothetical protein EAO73_28235 [Streptomyces sp. col6]|uniref:hypothetical protein n=1 Tax=Streptomyces sp. col6 TaxID=2478958 RepID=UPI0011CDFBB2|nr:hypothetical protein [Streptomyces sp. col6]TXR99802.1 hypothetical protein EAO73_28235 [Streptomyces sp. col6]